MSTNDDLIEQMARGAHAHERPPASPEWGSLRDPIRRLEAAITAVSNGMPHNDAANRLVVELTAAFAAVQAQCEKAAGTLWDAGDQIYNQDGWRADTAAALDALTIEDLLTLARLVGDGTQHPTTLNLVETFLDAVNHCDDAAERCEAEEDIADIVMTETRLRDVALTIYDRHIQEAGR